MYTLIDYAQHESYDPATCTIISFSICTCTCISLHTYILYLNTNTYIQYKHTWIWRLYTYIEDTYYIESNNNQCLYTSSWWYNALDGDVIIIFVPIGPCITMNISTQKLRNIVIKEIVLAYTRRPMLLFSLSHWQCSPELDWPCWWAHL